jgi:transposase InsO family protein
MNRKQNLLRRFQRRYIDSLWQFDVYEFRISEEGKVYVFNILDDRSRYLVATCAYKEKGTHQALNCLRWALKNGRRSKEIYADNAKCFRAKLFRQFCESRGIKVIYGRPYNPRGRGKLERFHRTLYEELISRLNSNFMSRFKKQLWSFRRKYNEERLHGAIGWATPSEVYYNKAAGCKHQTK